MVEGLLIKMEEQDKITIRIIHILRENSGVMNLGELKSKIGKNEFEKVKWLLNKNHLANWQDDGIGKDIDTKSIHIVESNAYKFIKDIKSEGLQKSLIKIQGKQTLIQIAQVVIGALLVFATIMLYFNGKDSNIIQNKLSDITEQFAIPNKAELIITTPDNSMFSRQEIVTGEAFLEISFINKGRLPTTDIFMWAEDSLLNIYFQRIEGIDSASLEEISAELKYHGCENVENCIDKSSEIPLGIHYFNTVVRCNQCSPQKFNHTVELCIYDEYMESTFNWCWDEMSK